MRREGELAAAAEPSLQRTLQRELPGGGGVERRGQ